jgi:hypothetical protein
MTVIRHNPYCGIPNPRFNMIDEVLRPHPGDKRSSSKEKMRSYNPGRKMEEQIATLRARECKDCVGGYNLSATALIGSRKGEKHRESE